ncbi:MAG TPA: Hpt domain-containing protein, partial [Acetobacteraceae bacterium]
MSIDISQFYQVFFEEAEELLAEMERLLLALHADAPDMGEIAAIFRAAHSIKGGAATFGLADMAEFTHVLESLLDRLRKGEMRITAAHVDAFFGAKDVLKMQLDGHRHGEAVDAAAVAHSRERLQCLLHGAEPAGALQPAAVQAQAQVQGQGRRYTIVLPTLPDSEADAIDALKAELAELGSLSASVREDGRIMLALETAQDRDAILSICAFVLDPEGIDISEQAAGYTAPDGSYGFFEPLAEPAAAVADAPHTVAHAEAPVTRAAAAEKAAHLESTSIRVGVEKVDQLINLVGELVITQAMLEQR